VKKPSKPKPKPSDSDSKAGGKDSGPAELVMYANDLLAGCTSLLVLLHGLGWPRGRLGGKKMTIHILYDWRSGDPPGPVSRVNPYTPASVLELAVKGKIVIGSIGKTKYQIVCTGSGDWPSFSHREDFVHMRANSSLKLTTLVVHTQPQSPCSRWGYGKYTCMSTGAMLSLQVCAHDCFSCLRHHFCNLTFILRSGPWTGPFWPSTSNTLTRTGKSLSSRFRT
jgi:hypothetical protein